MYSGKIVDAKLLQVLLKKSGVPASRAPGQTLWKVRRREVKQFRKKNGVALLGQWKEDHLGY